MMKVITTVEKIQATLLSGLEKKRTKENRSARAEERILTSIFPVTIEISRCRGRERSRKMISPRAGFRCLSFSTVNRGREKRAVSTPEKNAEKPSKTTRNNNKITIIFS
jgi:hypothetical protein